jgi:SOS response regulatory protein OraA/RecX
MKQSRDRSAPSRILAEFYREEFVKHQRCLEEQREYYSNSAVTKVEEALTRIISQLENLSVKEDADKVVSRLLRKFNVVTGLSGWTDPKNVH